MMRILDVDNDPIEMIGRRTVNDHYGRRTSDNSLLIPAAPLLAADPSNTSAPSYALESSAMSTELIALLAVSVLIICVVLFLNTSFLCLLRASRYRTFSNRLLLLLCCADQTVGLALTLITIRRYYHSQTRTLCLVNWQSKSVVNCVAPYTVLSMPVLVSALTTTAIALDRVLSLAKPLRYRSMVGTRLAARFAAMAILTAATVSSAPLIYAIIKQRHLTRSDDDSRSRAACSMNDIDRILAALLVASVYVPTSMVLVLCYMYVYGVAQSHVRAINRVEYSVGRQRQRSSPFRSGQIVMATGSYVLCWIPVFFGVVSQADWFYKSALYPNTVMTRDWLFLIGVLSSALNPIVYASHNTELKLICNRKIKHVREKFGFIFPSSSISNKRRSIQLRGGASMGHTKICVVHQENGVSLQTVTVKLISASNCQWSPVIHVPAVATV